MGDAVLPTDDKDKKKVKKVKVKKEKKPKEKKEKKPKEKKEKKPKDKKDKKKKEGQTFEIDVPGEITVDAQPDVVEETVVIPDGDVDVETPAVDMPEIEIPTGGF